MFSIMQDDFHGLDVESRELNQGKTNDEPAIDDPSSLHYTTWEVAEDLVEFLKAMESASKGLDAGWRVSTAGSLRRIKMAERERTEAKMESRRRRAGSEGDVSEGKLQWLQRLLGTEHDILQALVRIRQMEQEIAGQRLNAPRCRLRKIKEELGRVKGGPWAQEEVNTLGTPTDHRHEARKTLEALEAELAWLEQLCRSRMARADDMARNPTTLTKLLRYCEVS